MEFRKNLAEIKEQRQVNEAETMIDLSTIKKAKYEFILSMLREARREALEEAAQICDSAQSGGLCPDAAAAAIRAAMEAT